MERKVMFLSSSNTKLDPPGPTHKSKTILASTQSNQIQVF